MDYIVLILERAFDQKKFAADAPCGAYKFSIREGDSYCRIKLPIIN